MFKRTIFVAVIASSMAAASLAYCHNDVEPNETAAGSAIQRQSEPTRPTEDLLDKISSWLSSNFDLPVIKEHPAIMFTTKTELATMREKDRVSSQGFTQVETSNEPTQRRVVALYDNKLRTIFLTDDWLEQLPADQSILVHEMVHHFQNAAELKFECPMQREKLAYLAQDKWLSRFGMSLEKEFELDMFTILISSACMY